MPLAIALTIELFAGIVIGFIAAFIHIMRLKLQFKSLSRQISENKKID
jgi:putative membrane protein